MAFTKLGTNKATKLSKDFKKVIGYLLGVRQEKSRKFKGNVNSIYTMLQRDKKEAFSVWGSTVINGALLNEKQDGIRPNLKGVLVCLEWQGIKKSANGKYADILC